MTLSKKISIDLEDLWAIWSKGKATGRNSLSKPSYEDFVSEMHRDIADVVGDEEYLKLFKDGRWTKPNLKRDDE